MWVSYIETASYAITVLIALAHLFYWIGKRLFVTREEYSILEKDHEAHKSEDESVMGQLNIVLQGLKVSVDKNNEVTEKLGEAVNQMVTRQAVVEAQLSSLGGS